MRRTSRPLKYGLHQSKASAPAALRRGGRIARAVYVGDERDRMEIASGRQAISHQQPTGAIPAKSLARPVARDPAAYPFCLPFLARDFELGFDRTITIIVGENGTGKSTLLEGIAALAGYDEAGGGKGYRPVDHSRALEAMGGKLSRALRASWLPKITRGWFFRAESFLSPNRPHSAVSMRRCHHQRYRRAPPPAQQSLSRGSLAATATVAVPPAVAPPVAVPLRPAPPAAAVSGRQSMRLIARLVPGDLAGTGQAIYGTGIGAATVALTFLSGVLYERIGAEGFWVMSAVCGLALPMAIGLRKTIADDAIASPRPYAS